MIKQLSQWPTCSRPPRLLAINRVQTLVDEEADCEGEEEPARRAGFHDVLGCCTYAISTISTLSDAHAERTKAEPAPPAIEEVLDVHRREDGSPVSAFADVERFGTAGEGGVVVEQHGEVDKDAKEALRRSGSASYTEALPSWTNEESDCVGSHVAREEGDKPCPVRVENIFLHEGATR